MDTEFLSDEEIFALMQEDHPWLAVAGDSLDDEIIYSLDEIRFA